MAPPAYSYTSAWVWSWSSAVSVWLVVKSTREPSIDRWRNVAPPLLGSATPFGPDTSAVIPPRRA